MKGNDIYIYIYMGTWNMTGLIVIKIYKWKPFTTRPVARHKSLWEDDVRNGKRRMNL
jgi:hypothetical protein